jgi:hypothetical protein
MSDTADSAKSDIFTIVAFHRLHLTPHLSLLSLISHLFLLIDDLEHYGLTVQYAIAL